MGTQGKAHLSSSFHPNLQPSMSDLIESFDIINLASCAESLEKFQIYVDQPLASITLTAPTLTFPQLSDLIIYHDVTTGTGSLETLDLSLKSSFPVLDRLDLSHNLISVLPVISETRLTRLEMKRQSYRNPSKLSQGLLIDLFGAWFQPDTFLGTPVPLEEIEITLSFNDLRTFHPKTFRESFASNMHTNLSQFRFDGNGNSTSLDEDVFGPLLLHEFENNGDSLRR